MLFLTLSSSDAQLCVARQPGKHGQGPVFRLVLAHHAQRARQVQSVALRKSRPIGVRQAGHLQRVARDHFERQACLGACAANRIHDAPHVEHAFTQRHLRKQKAVRVWRDTHVFNVGADRVWRQRFHGIHGVVQQRDVVSRIQADAQPAAGFRFHQRRHFGRGPVLMILDRQRQLVLLHDAQRGVDVLVALGHGCVPIRQVGEILIAPARQAVDANGQRAGFLGCDHRALESRRIARLRQSGDRLEVHAQSLRARAESVDIIRLARG